MEDAHAATDQVRALGGAVKQGPDDTPYGMLALLADPSGAEFKFQAFAG